VNVSHENAGRWGGDAGGSSDRERARLGLSQASKSIIDKRKLEPESFPVFGKSLVSSNISLGGKLILVTSSGMADVRSMLRAERASRRITHPHASYTGDGKLLCNLCEALVKSEAAWQGHLHSTAHTLRLERAEEAAATRPANNDATGKKRKADSLEASPTREERKRARPSEVVDEAEDAAAQPAPAASRDETAQGHGQPTAEEGDVNEEELAAFERELAAMEAEARAQEQSTAASALSAQATISAAPMTAEELAAQAREEQSSQRGKRDAEIEDEKEDAERLLEEEFAEMETLEERVKRLRERREALRTGAASGNDVVEEAEGAVEEDEEDDDDEYDDNWAFGAR
jgi:zinc finger protein 830